MLKPQFLVKIKYLFFLSLLLITQATYSQGKKIVFVHQTNVSADDLYSRYNYIFENIRNNKLKQYQIIIYQLSDVENDGTIWTFAGGKIKNVNYDSKRINNCDTSEFGSTVRKIVNKQISSAPCKYYCYKTDVIDFNYEKINDNSQDNIKSLLEVSFDNKEENIFFVFKDLKDVQPSTVYFERDTIYGKEGAKVDLDPVYSKDPMEVYWSPTYGLNDVKSIRPTLKLENNTEYSLYYKDANGCFSNTAKVFIRVAAKARISASNKAKFIFDKETKFFRFPNETDVIYRGALNPIQSGGSYFIFTNTSEYLYYKFEITDLNDEMEPYKSAVLEKSNLVFEDNEHDFSDEDECFRFIAPFKPKFNKSNEFVGELKLYSTDNIDDDNSWVLNDKQIVLFNFCADIH